MARRMVAALAAGFMMAAVAPLVGGSGAAADPGWLEAPRNVRAAPAPAYLNGIRVGWTRPNAGDGSAYAVHRDLPDGSLPLVVNVSDTDHVFLSTGNNAGGAGYCFRVRRSLGGDSSGYSAQGCGSAAGTSPLVAPGALTVVGLAADRLYVSWVRPAPNDGSTYEVHQQQGDRWVRKAVVGDVYSTHVTGLDANTTYCLNVVRIRNGIRSGWSPTGCGSTTG